MRESRFYLIAVSIFLVSPFAVARSQATCHAADEKSARIIATLSAIMAPEHAAGRDSLGLPTATPSQISLVTDSATCVRAGQATDSIVRVWNPTTTVAPGRLAPLYVFKIGTSFGVIDFDSPNPSAHWMFLMFFGPLWNYLSMTAV